MKRKSKGVKIALRIYGGFLSKSWNTTWTHKQLWLIAAVAGLANTGAVFSRVMHRLWRIQPADQISFSTLRETFETVPWITGYVKNILTLGTTRIGITAVIILMIVCAVAYLVVAAQQIILHHANKSAKSKKYFTLDHLKKDLSHMHFARILATDLSVFVLLSILQLVVTLPLVLLLSNSLVLNAVVYVGLYLIVLPIGFILNAIGMLTLVNIVRRNQGIIDAVVHSWHTLLRHWLVIFELAVILYVINIAVTIALYALFAFISIPVALLTFAALASGPMWIMIFIAFSAGVTTALLAALMSGAMTMFNYSVWVHIANRLDRFAFISHTEHLAEKIFVRKS